MDERERNIWRNSTIIGIVLVLVYFFIITLFEITSGIILLKIVLSVLALIAYAIRLVIELVNHERCGYSIFMVICWFVIMVLNVMTCVVLY